MIDILIDVYAVDIQNVVIIKYICEIRIIQVLKQQRRYYIILEGKFESTLLLVNNGKKNIILLFQNY